MKYSRECVANRRANLPVDSIAVPEHRAFQGTALASLLLAASGVLAAPVATNDKATLPAGTLKVLIDVLQNDTPTPKAALNPATLKITSTPLHGSVTVGNGLVLYTATAGFKGNDTFRYTVEDTTLAISNAATVTISVPTAAAGYTVINLLDDPADGTSDMDLFGIVSSGHKPQAGGLDQSGYAYSASLLGSSITWEGIRYPLAPPDVADAAGDGVVFFPDAIYGSVTILATGVGGNQPGAQICSGFEHYPAAIGDVQCVTQNASDWGSPQSYPGESIAATMASRVTPSGSLQPGPWHLYAYTIPVDSTRALESIGFFSPRDKYNDVVILGMSVAPPPMPQAVPVYLDSHTNADAIDGAGDNYAFELLGEYFTQSGIPFYLLTNGRSEINGLTAATRTSIPGPFSHPGYDYFSHAYLLGTGFNGAQPNELLTISYADGTTATVRQGFSDWRSPQHYAGESIAKTMAYRVKSDGTTQQPGPWYLYSYEISLDPTKQLSKITLPNADVSIVGMTFLP